MTFDQLFVRATGIDAGPFPFQRRFATEDALPNLVRVPTGMGKTAMAVLGWLWRRRFAEDAVRQATPRRLVYCLPMRVLVEQTRDSVKGWLENLGLEEQVHVYVLMGGEGSEDWDLHPEKSAILIGTQDMLLSRALNRGYGMSRYRWPMHFGLLNNDCLWIFDEVQLMDVGVATSAQLEGFRSSMGVFGPALSIWMSATLDERWLETVDFPKEQLGRRLELGEQDFQHKAVKRLWTAPKLLSKSNAAMGDVAACADEIAEAHRPGTKTLAVFNTVKRAVEVFKRLKRLAERTDLPRPVLIHSRFRSEDREQHLQTFLESRDIIAVTTQVVEAGVDVSVTTLLTELAPWASLVQRFGRCNRRGGDQEAKVIWFDPGKMDEKSKEAAPYAAKDLQQARRVRRSCKDVSLQALDRIDAKMRLEAAHVIRRRDLVDLFDTTPDLAGNDIDVSRFIRSGDEHDVKVFWRDWDQSKKKEPPIDKVWRRVERAELCSVPVGDCRTLATNPKLRDKIWRWNPLEGAWGRAASPAMYPGQTYLVHVSAGGYDRESGWGSRHTSPVEPLGPTGRPGLDDSEYDDDGLSETDQWQTIADHTEQVCRAMDEIVEAIASLGDAEQHVLRVAARWHDWGKAHQKFQIKIDDGQELARRAEDSQVTFRRDRPDEWRGRSDIAKAPGERMDKDRNVSDPGFWHSVGNNDGGRRHFRHELASALAVLQRLHNMHRGLKDDELNLTAYLIAAHHGKVRLSIRSLPKELRPRDEDGKRLDDCLFARGVWDNDVLPETRLGGDVIAPAVKLSLEPMEMGLCEREPFVGQPSWAERMLRLRDEWGPFRLAYLEALLRAADMHASEKKSHRESH